LTDLDYNERAETMYQMHVKEYRTLTAIGKKFGLTKERVRQIVNKHKRGITDVQDIRTAGNRKNNHASKQGERST
jgi:DNA-directed RNA polymerase sigma subunit (sigma70/sigma32)